MADRSDTPRARAHARTRAEILAAAHTHLATGGAAGLSLRAVARDVGMVSSAVYRYFASRDDLLTALIIESYDAVGARVEEAVGGRGTLTRRFVRGLEAFHRWAREHPHEYLLLYGSAVPGYEAPQETVTPASRAVVALLGIVVQAESTGRLDPPETAPMNATLTRQAVDLADAAGVEVPPELLVRFLHSWAQIFGLVGLDVLGQLKGSFEPADALAAHTFREAARHIGLR